ncbi:TPA: divalent-cation tolerance protein CutA [Candidatus Nomurabacteria bacterium]|nr:MAG: hypothetical protein O210_OD1C00001G0678 [Parcubacteria bacterium RAAC4_OD1_1]HCY26106.1 divalent-cation tolerance protein CutA [Candidatus Nomurabacteria bacterium]
MIFEKSEKNSKEKDVLFVYTTCHSLEELRSISYEAIENKLAISADYWAVGSIYPWKKVLQETDQYMLVFTTEKEFVEKLTKLIESLHSYSVPMIAITDSLLFNSTYRFWIDSTLHDNNKYLSKHEASMNKEEDGVYHYGKLK